MRILTAMIVTCIAGQASAQCAAGQELFMSCTFNGGAKMVEVCVGTPNSTYTYGPSKGTAELQLVQPTAVIGYSPWGGVGRSIHESVVFYNNSVSYEVHGSIDRMILEDDDPDRVYGGINVHENDALLAQLVCDAGSTDFTWTEAVSDGKAAAGLCFNREVFDWVAC